MEWANKLIEVRLKWLLEWKWCGWWLCYSILRHCSSHQYFYTLDSATGRALSLHFVSYILIWWDIRGVLNTVGRHMLFRWRMLYSRLLIYWSHVVWISVTKCLHMHVALLTLRLLSGFCQWRQHAGSWHDKTEVSRRATDVGTASCSSHNTGRLTPGHVLYVDDIHVYLTMLVNYNIQPVLTGIFHLNYLASGLLNISKKALEAVKLDYLQAMYPVNWQCTEGILSLSQYCYAGRI